MLSIPLRQALETDDGNAAVRFRKTCPTGAADKPAIGSGDRRQLLEMGREQIAAGQLLPRRWHMDLRRK